MSLPHYSGQNQPAEVRSALLRWFRNKARPLPWRINKSAYPIWVSEVMLQQTQVATVIPYFERFIRAFPTVHDLAKAPLERVLQLWSGLGYYRRARQLRDAAKLVVEKFGGDFPREHQLARSLPGIGDYTARAILSIAYDLPFHVLDGNVARVVARLQALHGNIHQRPFHRSVEQTLDSLLSRRQPGSFNQAIMELGQTVCTPRDPRCSICPLRRYCRANQLGKPEIYPAPRPRRATELHYLATAVIKRGNRMGLIRGLDQGLLGDLWNFPSAFGNSQKQALTHLQAKLASFCKGQVDLGPSCGEIKHGITFRSIRVQLYPARVSRNGSSNLLVWFPVATLPQAAVSQLARKIAAHLPKSDRAPEVAPIIGDKA